MARVEKRLTARAVAAAMKPGMYADGGGLFLDVDDKGRRRWTQRFRSGGRRGDMGLGSPDQVSLAEVRDERDKWRAVVREGRDPIEARKRARDAERGAKVVTFGEAADSFIASHEGKWRNDKHRAQWRMTLDVYAQPLRDKPVAAIETADMLAVLSPNSSGPPSRKLLRGCVGVSSKFWTRRGRRATPRRTKAIRPAGKAI